MELSSIYCRLLLALGCLAIGAMAVPAQERSFGDIKDAINGRLPYPGTKYCARFLTSSRPDGLGVMEHTDRCCKHYHDCPASIPPMSWNYYKFNPHLFPMTHCSCDDEFFNCLKNVQYDHPEEVETAEAIGQWLFDGRFKGTKVAPAMPCFVFKENCVCLQQPKWDINDLFCKKWGVVEGSAVYNDYLENNWTKYPCTHDIDKKPKLREREKIVAIAKKFDSSNLKHLKPADYEECA